MIYRQENSETKTRWNRFEKAPKHLRNISSTQMSLKKKGV